MRICIIALGSRGDVQPCVILAHGLRAAGHDVCVATESVYEPLVRRYGVEFALIHGDVRGFMQTGAMRAMVDGKRVAPMARITWNAMDRRVGSGVKQRLVDVWEAAKNADAVVAATFGTVAGYSVAEKLRRPLIRVFYSPPDLPITRGFRSRPRFDRLMNKVYLQSTWSLFRSSMNQARRDVLGLPPLPVFNPTNTFERRGWPALCAFSSHACPPPQDRKLSYHVTGYWFANESAGWQPPRELTDFLDAGAPPVYVGFGSMVHQSPEATTKLVTEALALAGSRGILATGWGGLNGAAKSDRLFVIDDAPHDWLFSRCAAMVHHGGAGTTAASLRAGRPAVIVPFGVPEQPFWGERIAALGAGPAPLDRKHLTPERLAQAIRTMVEDKGMRRRAAALGERISAENGVARAVEVLETSVREFAWT